jgi:hypothetical protein
MPSIPPNPATKVGAAALEVEDETAFVLVLMLVVSCVIEAVAVAKM